MSSFGPTQGNASQPPSVLATDLAQYAFDEVVDRIGRTLGGLNVGGS